MVGSNAGSVTSISVATSQANVAQMQLLPAALSDRIRLVLEQTNTQAALTAPACVCVSVDWFGGEEAICAGP